jgi:hypothetical protein
MEYLPLAASRITRSLEPRYNNESYRGPRLILWDLAPRYTTGEKADRPMQGGRIYTMRQLSSGISRRRTTRAAVVSLAGVWLLVGCASHSLMPATQSAAIRDRERGLAPHAQTIQTAVSQSGRAGALAFLDATDGRLVVLPGDSPADAWARYATSPESERIPVTAPEVVTFVYRKDIAKAPETVVQSVLLQQQAQMMSVTTLATELRRIEDRLNVVHRELTATQRDTDKAMADMRALVDDVAAVRKFMLQTAQLGWLNHELTLENATGIRRMAATSQELAASSAKLDDTLRQLSESLAGLSARLEAIQGKIQNLH